MHDLLEIWNGWDARWYMGIAREGYHIQKQFGFFPLFPALTHLVGLVLGHRWLAARYISSTGRYLTAAVPAFLVIGGWLRRSGLELGYLSAGFMLQALFTQQFMAEEWIG